MLREQLEQCSGRAGVSLTHLHADRLCAYLELLKRWNQRINLTSLPLDGYPAATLDRLIGEPLVAASVAPAIGTWFDLGSGGGSPAVPLRIMREGLSLRMVESRERKAAFLREVVRQLELDAANVLSCRFQELEVGGYSRTSELVTVRAVRLDQAAMAVTRSLLKVGGRLLLFGGVSHRMVEPVGFTAEGSLSLPSRGSVLYVYNRAAEPEDGRLQ